MLGSPTFAEAAERISPLLVSETAGRSFPGGGRSRWHDASARLKDFLAQVTP
jgi:hypothetical protein